MCSRCVAGTRFTAALACGRRLVVAGSRVVPFDRCGWSPGTSPAASAARPSRPQAVPGSGRTRGAAGGDGADAPLWRAALAAAGLGCARRWTGAGGSRPATARGADRGAGAARALAAPATCPGPSGCCAARSAARGGQRALADRAGARLAKVRTHEARRRILAGGDRRAARALRRPQHAAPRATPTGRADLRPRQRGPAAPGARRALGPRRARARPRAARATVGRRLPRPARLRRPRGQLDLRGRRAAGG